jgi:hypothetical protein
VDLGFPGDGQVRTSFLKPGQIHGRYSEMMAAAKDCLVLVFPWMTLSAQLRDEITGLLARDIRLVVVTRPPEEARSAEHEEALQDILRRQRRVVRRKLLGLRTEEFDLVEVLLVENVHAKCVIQDEAAVVVSSSNLNETSSMRNPEFGMYSAEPSVVRQALAAVQDLRTSDRCRSTGNARISKCHCGRWKLTHDGRCDCERAVVAAPPAAPVALAVTAVADAVPSSAPPTDSTQRTSDDGGFCIRCRAPLARNRERPLCGKCYRSWARYKNPEFTEKHCHHCGAESPTSMARALCRDCYGNG